MVNYRPAEPEANPLNIHKSVRSHLLFQFPGPERSLRTMIRPARTLATNISTRDRKQFVGSFFLPLFSLSPTMRFKVVEESVEKVVCMSTINLSTARNSHVSSVYDISELTRIQVVASRRSILFQRIARLSDDTRVEERKTAVRAFVTSLSTVEVELSLSVASYIWFKAEYEAEWLKPELIAP